jgi:hypothetical protein
MPSKTSRFNRTLRIGLLFLLIASAGKFMLENHSAMPDGPRDGIVGLLYGIAIGCMLLGLHRMTRGSGPAESACSGRQKI